MSGEALCALEALLDLDSDAFAPLVEKTSKVHDGAFAVLLMAYFLKQSGVPFNEAVTKAYHYARRENERGGNVISFPTSKKEASVG